MFGRTQAMPGRLRALALAQRFVAALIGAAAAGSALAQVSVSENGTPTYSQAIAVPPGIAGMAPNIGLLYSGGGVNGPLGYGWSIQGISTITRCPAIKAIDGVTRGVTYGVSDKLCLDGQRLIQTDASGTVTPAPVVDANGKLTSFPQINDSQGGTALVREYRTEKDTFARIRAYGTAGTDPANGPAYFKVWTKSGQIYEYGNNANGTANAAIAIQGKTAISAWAVSRISDTLGNFIDFQYEQRDTAWGSGPTAGSPTLGHEWNLVEIRYTGRAGQDPINRIRFDYSDRAVATTDASGVPTQSQDRGEAYQLGAKNVSVRRLDAVRVYTNWPGSVAAWPTAAPSTALKVRTVKLTYDQGPVTNRSRLVKIQECAGAAETACLPPASFTYSAGGNQQFQASASFNLGTVVMQSQTGNYGVLTGNFMGTGRTDIIRWSDNPAENLLYKSNGDGSFQQATNFNITTENLFKSDNCYVTLVTDINGDGLSDLLRYSAPTNLDGGACAASGPIYVYLSNGDGTFAQATLSGPPLERTISKFLDNCLVQRTQSGYCAEPGLHSGWTRGANFFLMDVNGDGKLDIVTTVLPYYGIDQTGGDPCTTATCTRVFTGNGDGSFTEIATNLIHVAVYTPPKAGTGLGAPRNVADMNGDGYSDLVGIQSSNFTTASVFFSRGDGNFDAAGYNSGCTSSLDFNGDGRSDCLVVDPNGTALNGVLLSDVAGGFTYVASFNLKSAGQELGGTSAGYQVVDVDGDGRHDILRWKDDPQQNKLYLSNGDGSYRESTSFNLKGTVSLPNSFQLQKSDGTAGMLAGDFTGRGRTEILRLKSTPTLGADTANQLYVPVDLTVADQLISATSSSGLKTDLTWVALTNSSSGSLGARYTTDRGTANAATFPAVDLNVPAQVVVTSLVDTGVGLTRVATEYAYAGLKASYDGRGAQGFRETRRQTVAPDGSNLTVVTKYLQGFPYAGVAHTTETYIASLNGTLTNPLSRSSFTYCEKTAANGADALASPTAPCAVPATTKVHRPYLYKSTEEGRDLLSNTLPTVTTINTFNGTGDPLTIVVTTSGTALGLSQTVTKTTTNQYNADDTTGDNWILGRLQRATQQSSVPNSLGSITAGYGAAARANATQGTREPLQVSIAPASVSATSTNSNLVSAGASVTTTGTPSPTLPLSYAWARVGGATTAISTSGGASPTFIATLAANQTVTETYRVTVTDGAGRTGTADVPVTLALTPPVLSSTASPNPLLANRTTPGTLTGTITVAGSGGVAPYNVAWSRLTGSRISVTGTSTGTFSGTLTWGESVSETFRATLTDAVGQVKTNDVTVTFAVSAQPVVSVSPSVMNLTRANPGSVSGTMTATASGGTPPFSYSWVRTVGTRGTISSTTVSNPTVSATLAWAESATETWRVTVTDAAANTAQASLTVNYSTPAQPSVTVSPSAQTLSRNNPGVVSTVLTASPAGGLTPYTYSWSRITGTRSTASSSTIANPTISASLNLGENFSELWRATVTDAGGNVVTADSTLTFTTPSAPSVAISPTSLSVTATAGASAAGTVTASPSGGVAPYTYSWTRSVGTRSVASSSTVANPTISATVNGGDNFTDTWIVTITDSGGNSASASVGITFIGVAPPSITVTPTTYAYGSIKTSAAATFTVTNSGGPGVINTSLSSTVGSRYSISATTCPANGATMAGSSSCTVQVTYRAQLQCGGSVTQRVSTLQISVGSSSTSSSLNAADWVYAGTAPQCQ